MGDFEIECKKVMRWAEEIGGCSGDVKRQAGRVADVIRQMRFQENDYRGMEQALSGIADRLHGQQEQLRQYGGMLEQIVRAYEHTEAGIQAEGDGYRYRWSRLEQQQEKNRKPPENT